MSLPPLCFVMSHLQNRATGHWLLMSVSVSSILDRLLLALTYFARCLDDNTSPSCKLGAAVHLQSQSLMNLVNPEEDQTTGLIFSGFLQLLLLRTCSRNQPVVNFGGAEERCALFLSKQQTDMSLKKKICWRIHFDCPQLDGCRQAFYTLISGCAENLKYNFSDNNLTYVVC